MANDSTREVRRAGMARLKAWPAVTQIVGARVYGQAPPIAPDWPFVRWGTPSLVPLRASCLDGAEIMVAVHGFAKQRLEGGAVAETAEDHASRLGAALARALDGYRAAITGGTAAFLWTGGRLLQDGAEADAFHTVQNFRIRCMTGHSG